MKERTLNLNVRVTEEERAKMHALADHDDLTVSILVRRWIRDRYSARFGDVGPAKATESPK